MAGSQKPRPFGQTSAPQGPDTPATAKAIEAAKQPGRIKVRALSTGTYGEERKRKGDIFTISPERYPADYKYNPKDHPNVTKQAKKDGIYGLAHPRAGALKELGDWMAVLPAGDKSPEHTTSAPQALAKESRGSRPGETGGDDNPDRVLT